MNEILEKIILDTAREAGEKMSENLNQKERSKCEPEIIPGIFREENKKNSKNSTFIFSSVVGLAVCLGVLTAYKQEIPEDVKDIISAITNVFSECLKEAYSSEFGISNTKKNKKAQRIFENFSK